MYPSFKAFDQRSFKLTTVLPPDYRGFILRGGTVLTARNSTGTMVLQEVVTADFSIRFHVFDFLRPIKITGLQNATTLLSLMAIKNNIRWTFKGLRKVQLREGQFSLLHSGEKEVTAWFEKDRTYHSLEIEWSPDRIRELLPYFPFLQPVLEQATANKSFFVQRPAMGSGPKAFAVAHDILKSPYEKEYNQIFFDNKVREYLMLLMIEANKKETPDIKLTLAERDAILAIAYRLSHEANKKFPIEMLAKESGMNQMKLKMGFKAITGSPIFQYQLRFRMEEAHRLILEGRLNPKQIADITGYRSAANLLEQFAKYFGYTATSIRKK